MIHLLHFSTIADSCRNNCPFLSSSLSYSCKAESILCLTINWQYNQLPKRMSFTPEFTHWDSDDQEELLKLISTWPCTISNTLDKTAVIQHKITLTDNTPLKSWAYRVSPIKKADHQGADRSDALLTTSSFPPLSWSVILVLKSDSSNRYCVDYRKQTSRLNPLFPNAADSS